MVSDMQLNAAGQTETVFEITEASQQLVIENIKQEPVPSLLRGFSAPIKLDYDYSPEQLAPSDGQ